MLSKLAFKNVTKSIKEYAIYFLTLAFGVCVFYMFNSIYDQQAMINLTAEQSKSVYAINGILNYISVFVAVVLGFLIVYANNFFIKRRKKELGIYMTLGMEKTYISIILVLETSLMALSALIVGLLSGVILSQFMSLFTAKIFETDMTKFAFIFSIDAMLKSIIYFSIIFIIVIVFNILAINKFKLIDLIYGARENEDIKVENAKITTVLFIISIILLGTAYYLIIKNGIFHINMTFFTSILLGSVGTIIFFYSLSGILITVINGNKNIYFKNLNMFVVRQLSSKMNTNFVSISVVCIVLLLTIGIFATGYSMQKVYSSETKGYAGFDYSFYSFSENEEESPKDFNELKKFLDENENVKGYKSYYVYNLENKLGDFGIKLPSDFLADEIIRCVSISDYNKIIELQGGDKVTLRDNEYAILTNYKDMISFADKILEDKYKLKVGDINLIPSKSLEGSIKNGMIFLMIILPDKYAHTLESNSAVLNMDCKSSEAAAAFNTQIEKLMNSKNREKIGFQYYESRAKIYAEAISSKAMLSYIAIYLGIVFMMTCAAILAIQQLTEAADNKYRYELLLKLGVDKKMINHSLFIQILCYFLFPLLLASIHSIFGLVAVNNTLKEYGTLHMEGTIIVTALFVGALYLIYFMMTYISSKSVINKK